MTIRHSKSIVSERYLDRWKRARSTKRESPANLLDSLRTVGMSRYVAVRNPADGLWYGLPDLTTLDATVMKCPGGMPLRVVPDLMCGRKLEDLPEPDHCPKYRDISGTIFMFLHVQWDAKRAVYRVRTKVWFASGLSGDWQLSVSDTRRRIGWIPEQPLRFFRQ